jgi:ATP-dependent RNA helicase RhlE
LTDFSSLGLAAPILKALQGQGYTQTTPIQAMAIPIILGGRDVLGIAQTGTGKTAAFALPIIQRLAADRRPAQRKGCRALVLSPTRELASQIAQSFRTYGRHLDLTVAVVFGGVGHRPQVQALARGVDVLVAAPGRLIDHLRGRDISLAGTEILVLDEADRMLDLGFLPPIRRIVSHMSSKRQNLFFSATMPQEIGRLANELLRDPVRVAAAPIASTVDGVTQRVIHVESDSKRALLVELLTDPRMSRTLVFTRTKRGADRVARHLETAGIRVAVIHGNRSQSQREQALAAFRASRIRVLVATDIAARGIDIDRVTHVVNFELPDVAESYVHRIGRTARAGSQGIAISLCSVEEREQLRAIERLTRRPIPAEDRCYKTGGRPSRQTRADETRSGGFRSSSVRGHPHASQTERRRGGRSAPRPVAA